MLRHPDAPVALASVRAYELVNRDGRWLAEPRPHRDAGLPLPGFEVQAVGVLEGDERLNFDIFCGDQEFTVEEYGDRLVPAVAHYIRSQRRSDEPYPIYLTDLHLPHDLDPQVYQQDIQTSQYLAYRRSLEEALNRHLAT